MAKRVLLAAALAARASGYVTPGTLCEARGCAVRRRQRPSFEPLATPHRRRHQEQERLYAAAPAEAQPPASEPSQPGLARKVARLVLGTWTRFRDVTKKLKTSTKVFLFALALLSVGTMSRLPSHQKTTVVETTTPSAEVVAQTTATDPGLVVKPPQSAAATEAQQALAAKSLFLERQAEAREVPYSQFVGALHARRGGVSDVVVSANRYDFTQKGKPYFATPLPVASDDAVVSAAIRSGVAVTAAPVATKDGVSVSFAHVFAIAYVCFVIAMLRQMLGGGMTGSVGQSFGGPNRKRKRDFFPRLLGWMLRSLLKTNKKWAALMAEAAKRERAKIITFDDVAGINPEARVQVEDLKDLVQNSQKYAAVGARAPKGILLVGPPGTGKTLLARALANEAQVPFLYCSGSDFVEIFAGRGAARVRQLFQKAAKFQRCIVFIDELDAVGRARQDSGMRASDTEQEQTLMQLLAAMDGVQQNSGLVVLGATNRLRILDPALVRPGRFDRIVRVDPPDADGRLAILKVHAAKINLADDAEPALRPIADLTTGLVGADLAAIVNEAAVCAVRANSTRVTTDHLTDALTLYLRSRTGPLPAINNPLNFLFDGLAKKLSPGSASSQSSSTSKSEPQTPAAASPDGRATAP